MKAMILAAGLGNRLKPLTDRIPKCMVPISGKPILEHNIEWLHQYDIDELVINLYHLPGLIHGYFGDGSRWGVQITYSHETTILGTAGGIKKVAELFNETFLVWYGDNLSTCNLKRLADFHSIKGGLATIALYQREDVSQSGIAELDENERIIRFLEKPKVTQVFSRLVNAGIYILEPEILDFIPDDKPADFSRDVFPTLLSQNQAIYGYRMSGDEKLWWIDTMEDLQNTQREMEQEELL